MRIDTARIGQLVLGFSTTSRERAAQRERVFFGEDDDGALSRSAGEPMPQAERAI